MCSVVLGAMLGGRALVFGEVGRGGCVRVIMGGCGGGSGRRWGYIRCNGVATS